MTQLASGPARMQGGVKLWIAVVLLLLIAGPVAYTELMLHWNYSTGERAGWLQKLSRKGLVCKTDEGELSMVAMPGATPEKFYFTVRDEAVAVEINRLMGHRVSLVYEQKIGLPTSCFGDTQYFVTAVHVVEEGSPAATPAPSTQ
jgi:hypothetical protein